MKDVLERILTEETERHGVPGAACGIVLDGEEHTAAVGVTSVEAPAPVDDETLFQVGSISKLFTALAVMLLAEDGALALEEPVARHLPDLADTTGLDTDAITLEHLLSHQAGFDGDILFFSRGDQLAGIRGARQYFVPGTGFSYNNAGFSITGAVVEAVSGESFDDFVRHRILEPLGMRKSCFSADRAIYERVALPHWVLPDHDPVLLRRVGWQPGWELAATDWAAGGLASSVRDQLAWCRFNLGDGRAPDGTQLVSAEGLRRLHDPVVEGDPPNRIGLDWHRWSVDGVVAIGHGGLIVGYCSDLTLVPDRAFGFVCFVHATNGKEVHRSVRRRVLGEVLGLNERDPVPTQPGRPAEALAEYAGTYAYSFGPVDIEAAGDGHPGELVATPREHPPGTVKWQPPPDPPTRLAFYDDDEAIAVDGLSTSPRRVRFGRDGDGKVVWLMWGGRRAPRVG